MLKTAPQPLLRWEALGSWGVLLHLIPGSPLRKAEEMAGRERLSLPLLHTSPNPPPGLRPLDV